MEGTPVGYMLGPALGPVLSFELGSSDGKFDVDSVMQKAGS